MYAKTRLGHCEECNHLWRAYAAATINQFQLHGKLRVATLEQRHVAELTTALEAAEAAQAEAREALLCHERTHARAAKA